MYTKKNTKPTCMVISMASSKRWLVEIRLKDWIPDLKTGGRILAFEEVFATTNIGARYAGYDKFRDRAEYSPRLKKLLKENNLSMLDYCAPDAVELD